MSNMARLGALWRQLCNKLGHNTGNIARHEASSMQKIARNSSILRISYCAGHVHNVEPMWSPTWAGSCWSNLGPSCALLGQSWSQVGRSWAQVGALLAKLDPKLSPCCGYRVETVTLDDVLPIVEMCKLLVSWLKLYNMKPLNYHTLQHLWHGRICSEPVGAIYFVVLVVRN